MTEPDYYARKGEVCTCTKGHSVFTFRRNVIKGRVPKDGDTWKWQQKKLRVGDAIPNCGVCGSRFAFNDAKVGFFVCIARKWRTSGNSAVIDEILAGLT